MDSNALLDEAKKRLGLSSDNELAERLGYTRQWLSDMRRKGLSSGAALQIATLIGLPEEEVLTAIEAEREKDPTVKAVRKKIAESMRRALGLAAFVAVLLVLGAPPRVAEAAYHGARATFDSLHIIRRRVLRFLRSWRLLGGLALLTLTACGANDTSHTTPTDEPANVACTYSGPTGICVAFADAAAADIPALDYERAYRFVEQCMTDNYGTPGAPGPAVLVYSDLFEVDGQRVGGWTSFSTGLIQVHGFGTLYHEYVHYLLWRAGFPNEANANHEHPAFLTCGARAGFIDG